MLHRGVKELGRTSVLVLLIIVVLSAAAWGALGAPVSSGPAPSPSPSLGTGLAKAAVAAEPASTARGTASAESDWANGTPHLRRAQDNDIRFERISIEQGLSQSVVYAILQDSKGFMWFGTQDGLNRYDGYEFTVYKRDPESPSSLSDDFAWSMYEDRSGVLWIGTNGGGLNRLDRDTGQFICYQNDPNDPYSLSHDVVQAIHEDQSGVLWLGTGGGLDRFDRETGQFIHYWNDPDDPHSLGNDQVWSVYEDQEGVLWIGTNGGGLDRFDRETGQFIHYQNDPNDPHSLSDNAVCSIYQDRDGLLWIGTHTGGLNRLDRGTGQFTRYQHDADDPHSLSHNNVHSIYQDRGGVLWIGTHDGLDRFDRQTGQFVHYQNDLNDPHSLSNNQVWSIYEDQAGVLWIGTFGGGLSKFDRLAQRFAHYRADPDDPQGLSDNVIWSLHQDQEGVLWVGTQAGGLNRFDRDTGQFVHYRNDPSDPHSLSDDQVWSIYQDREDTLWIGTSAGLDRFDRDTEQFAHYPALPVFSVYQDREGVLWIGTWGGGLGRFERETEQFTYYQNVPTDTHSLSNNTVGSICQDREGDLWIGTQGGGLDRFDRDTRQFIHYQNDPDDPHSLSHNLVLSVHQDREGVLWIATLGGLNRLDRAKGTFTHYREKDGLANDTVYGILEDDRGHLWLSTNRGLSEFDPQTETFRNYGVEDGLQSNEFNMGAYHRGSSGEMFFGGINGFNAFHPDSVTDNPYIPPIVVTDFQLFNESVEVGGDSPLQQPIAETQEIELSYKDDFFSFEFAALHYSSPEKNQYAYMMEGLDRDWNYVGTRRFAGYTSVPPGRYTFRVKGSNSDGVWNEQGASIKVIITPPFWQTWWFRILMAVVVIGGALGAVTLRIRAIEAQRRQLEVQVDERTKELRETLVELERSKEAAEAASRAKSVFLANMSHELRTPLNAILGFTQLMARDASLTAAQQENLGIIGRSGEHLLGLINEVLEMSKIEAGRIALNEQGFDLYHMLTGLEEMFHLRAEDKGLALTFDLSPDVPQYVRMDEGKLRQVLINLLGNAVKFTQEGSVMLRVGHLPSAPSAGEGEARLCFEVEDTGPGIASEELAAVFDPFVQTATGQQSQEGTGLGLPISRQFVRLMGGDLTVTSQLGQGSTFTFDVPIRLVDAAAMQAAQITRRAVGLEPGQPVYRLLVVDDKEMNRKLLVKLLTDVGPPPMGFEVQEAVNGREALEIWERWEPHLIWMDMRMPVMDGYEATRRIKATTKGQATVIVAVTASALEEDRRIILSEGCDAYIRKPVQAEDLFDALTKHLGVRFVYEELGAGGPPQGALSHRIPQDADAQLAEGMVALPADWVASLQEATILGDWGLIFSLIDRIRERDVALAEALAAMAQHFDHDRILTLIQQTGKEEESDG